MTFIPSTFKCNGCGRERTPSNGWYELHVQVQEDVVEASLYICAFKGSEASNHYCGKECLIRAISARLLLFHLGSVESSRSEAPVEPEAPCSCDYDTGKKDPNCGVHSRAGI